MHNMYAQQTSSIIIIQTCFYFVRVKTCVPVHLRLVSSLFEALRSLQSKFSSQNSANHTFLRLFSSVSAVKYSSNPGSRGKRRSSAQIINLEEMKHNVCSSVIVVWRWPLGVGSTAASTTSSKFVHSGSSSSHTPWNFNHFFHLGNYIN